MKSRRRPKGRRFAFGEPTATGCLQMHVSDLITHAQGLFNVGASVKAAAILGEVPIRSISSSDYFATVMLASELGTVGIMTKNRSGDWNAGELIRICTERMKRPSLSSADRALERASMSTVLGLHAGTREDRDGLFSSIACADDALRGPAYAGQRSAETAFVNFHAKYAIWQSEYGRHQEANDSLSETSVLLESIPDVPLMTRIDHLVARAWMRSLAPRTAHAARRDIEAVHALGLANGVPNALWTAQYFRALHLRVQGKTDEAIEILASIVHATRFNETAYWEALVAPRLIFALASKGDTASAWTTLRAFRQPYPVISEVLHCIDDLRARNYVAAEARSTSLYRGVERFAHRMYRFVALLVRANARHGLGNRAGCESDLEEAYAICAATPTPFGYMLKRAAGAIANLSSDKRRIATAREILRELADPAIEPYGAARLTTRQREIALLAAEGASNIEIAGRLNLSRRTVENHLFGAMQRLGVRARWQLRSALTM